MGSAVGFTMSTGFAVVAMGMRTSGDSALDNFLRNFKDSSQRAAYEKIDDCKCREMHDER
jgi:hypothetical protein